MGAKEQEKAEMKMSPSDAQKLWMFNMGYEVRPPPHTSPHLPSFPFSLVWADLNPPPLGSTTSLPLEPYSSPMPEALRWS